MAIRVFVDFDGTISTEDVGNSFFRNFGGERCADHIAAYRAETISAQECFRREIAEIRNVSKNLLDEFFQSQSIDETFPEFVNYCASRSLPLSIVSDGLDYYIHNILTVRGIVGIPVFANKLDVEENGRYASLHISFPYADSECTRCGCSKRNILLSRSGEDDVLVFIGEGYSDRCPAHYADLVFAKDELQTYCQRENITYFVYSSFRDVMQRMEILLNSGRMRKRRRAEIHRRSLLRCR
jgi:2-hydroxy-3-keto-5-methylthiopentenyl-1-phosphate phosphatase